MFRIPARTFTAFARILNLPGTENIQGLQREAVPVWDQNRVLQDDRVSSYMYLQESTPAASVKITLEFDDLSDWTEVLRNGVIVAADDGLPPRDHDRIVTWIGLQISGTQAHYTTSEVNRFMPTTGGSTASVIEFGAITSGHRGPLIVSPWTLPYYLAPQEGGLNIAEEVSGNASDWHWSVQLISAEPGVMSKYLGV